MGDLCIPKDTASLVKSSLSENRCNHFLLLDKFSVDSDPQAEEKQQQKQKEVLNKVAALNQDELNILPGLLLRRNMALNGSAIWNCSTSGPLTLHLSRASALENAGICMHPIYGFVYLPGSGLKGMARAYAETVWKPAQTDQNIAQGKIEQIFGNEPGERENDKQTAGSIIFHDAWPTSWPSLEVDIVNSHHSKYYQGTDNRDAPGDWEDPILVYFLAVGAGNTFSFALGKRLYDTPDECVERAREWLIGALCHMGAGAKTNAGYGSFQITDSEPVEHKALELSTHKTFAESRAVYETTLELVTPAFLAGANQEAGDCDLRPATLRGQLRWWWRTMHAGYLDVKTLRQLEAAIWGDTKRAGAVRVEVSKPVMRRALYDKKSAVGHDFERAKNNKTTQGLFYASFGMHDGNNQRYLAQPTSKWTITITARNNIAELKSQRDGATDILNQAKAALWLLCQHGGIGAKSRKGFGSFADVHIDNMSFDECIFIGQNVRNLMKIPTNAQQTPECSALSNVIKIEVSTKWRDPWFALDQLGFSAQSFAQSFKHRLEKKALGLPRQIKSPISGSFNSSKGDMPRHSSPTQFHLARNSNGQLDIRIIAFPAKYLPDMATSKKFLADYLKYLKEDLEKRAIMHSTKGSKAPSTSISTGASQSITIKLPAPGNAVKARLLEEKTKKGGWKAEHMETKIKGPIQNTQDVPSDKAVGDVVDLIVSSANSREIAFKWIKNS